MRSTGTGFAAYARPMSLAIRPAAAGDLAAVLQLWRDAAQPTSTDTESALRALVAHDAGALIVALESGRIVGTVIAGWDGWRGSVYRLVVAPESRRSGLGRQLVRSAERRLAELGAQRMQAVVVGPDARAMGFWSATEWDLQGDQVRFARGG
jgi:ribosomal protein S18 acetylase RimI-like enzyme